MQILRPFPLLTLKQILAFSKAAYDLREKV